MDYYEILGVDKKASLKTIQKAYKVLVKKYHPDTCQIYDKKQAEEKFRQISRAYEVLSDEKSRTEYDTGMTDSEQLVIEDDDVQDADAEENATFSKRKDYGSYDHGEIGNNFTSTKTYDYAPNKDNSMIYRVKLFFICFLVISVLGGLVYLGVRIDKAKPQEAQVTQAMIIGKTKEDVRKAFGKPDRIISNQWIYGKSIVYFNSAQKMVGWKKVDERIKVFLGSKAKNPPKLKVGDKKQTVILVMGTPDYLYMNVWKYGGITIKFDTKGRVKSITQLHR
jgi:outer membrane protein assembly factor BamE (lipoprotein component of BamABCDE complex)